MVLHKRLIILLYCFTLITVASTSCYSNNFTKSEKIKIFFQYDYLFHFGGWQKIITVEESQTREIFNLVEVNLEYQGKAKEYLEIITEFIESNIGLLKDYYLAATDLSMDQDKAMSIYNQTKNSIAKDLFPKLPDAIRCMVGSYDSQYIEIALELDANTFAYADSDSFTTVFWKDYYRDDPPPYINPEGILDDQGVIKYHEWFYESNLKLRVVKQIRDKDGKYYGEIYADYYKLDEYDKLFDKDGNPKHPKEDAK